MRTADALYELVAELESQNNEVLVRASESPHSELLDKVAEALLGAAEILKKAAEEVEEMGPDFTAEDLDNLAAIATEFDQSGDEDLQKQASVLDEILSTVGVNMELQRQHKKAAEEELMRLRDKFRDQNQEKLYSTGDDKYKEEAVQAIEKTVKPYRPLETPLSTRTCPDHPGSQMMRIADHVYQCELDKAVYNWEAGFTTMKGRKVPGSSVSNQSQVMQQVPDHTMFSSREQVLNKDSQ